MEQNMMLLEAEVAEAANELQSADKLKVIELSKKSAAAVVPCNAAMFFRLIMARHRLQARALNLELGRERQKVAQLQQKLSEATASAKAETKPGGEEGAEDARARELALCKERVQQMTNKMGHLEQKVFLLEGENKRLVRALVREVGEDVPLAEVLEGGSGWKGRQQQITHLKDTVRQLREAAGVGPAASKAESAHRSVIGKLSRERMDATARLEGELAAARAAADQLRLQSSGASSRCKVLEAEVATLRGKLAVVLQKTQSDDKLLAALTSKLSRLEAAGGAGASAAQPDPLQWRIATSSQQAAAQQYHRQAAAAAEDGAGAGAW